ncbi:hypothetical protein D6833_10435 [Candidatus Parcubacteria bacterium]|nr:MAG: hypothetical protein D6833_10435 [Candidatus Parcubacteria bacterium]
MWLGTELTNASLHIGYISESASYSDRFWDWLFMALAAFLIWGVGYVTTDLNFRQAVHVPYWLAKIAGARMARGHKVDIVGFATQIAGEMLFICSFYTWIAPSHEDAVQVFSICVLLMLPIMWLIRLKWKK